MMDSEEMNHQTWSCQYDNPPTKSTNEYQPKSSNESLSSPNGTLHIPPPKVDVPHKIPKGPLCRNVSSSKASRTYSIVDDLEQSLATMSTMEVLHTCPSQQKAMLSSLGSMDPSDDRMIIFDVDKMEHPSLSSSISFQIQSPLKTPLFRGVL